MNLDVVANVCLKLHFSRTRIWLFRMLVAYIGIPRQYKIVNFHDLADTHTQNAGIHIP